MLHNDITNNKRIEEIDFARGIAILLMILFHLIVDLKDFYFYNVDYFRGFWYIEGKLSAILFMFLCGISSTLSFRSTNHGIKVFTWAMVLTAVTYFYNSDFYIRFGILHFLGISLISARFIQQLSIRWLFSLSITSITLGLIFAERFVNSPYLFPLGLQSATFTSLDFYPLFPWYGVFLAGIIAGKTVYAAKKSSLTLHPPQAITWLGRQSLAIYLIHQPILLALLYVIHGK
ncbi:heparan-alpha-glucosaminide N-acetyltransferase [Pelosinus sp. IPA-1]|uniref:heparan-alpha-glucosaminide N-acetyltransferase n=1 Tax=Pelosinus sp. IPA-1 TaxID=3029569 RepID=UPI00243628FF|nr:heparan-alpha-glucosaminide N-acetyltransferase [Pelosinus sp. IPA-1]GMA97543.1 hypothetical protein PIPA1_03430 [Pelosinus sp. IPA-1]